LRRPLTKLHSSMSGKQADSIEAGRVLLQQLPSEGLSHVIVFADGGLVNGSDLRERYESGTAQGCHYTGGLAGDGTRFEKTIVGLNSSSGSGNIVAIGLYGDSLEVGYGSVGGWGSFGPERRVTKSVANVLYELDGKSALSLYKQYLGELADQLPGSTTIPAVAARRGSMICSRWCAPYCLSTRRKAA
jgi:hypothetical protein